MVTVEEAVSEPEGFRLAGARRVVDPGTGDCMGGSDGPGWELEAVEGSGTGGAWKFLLWAGQNLISYGLHRITQD